LFGSLYDVWLRYGLGTTDRTRWFMLYHPQTGDRVMVGDVQRGHFRLHPKGPLGTSQGCIVVIDPADFDRLERFLRSAQPEIPVPRSRFMAYGTVEVR